MIVGKKGQITIPKGIREALQISAGDCVEIVELAPGHFFLTAPSGSITSLKGMFGEAKKIVSVDDLNHAIATAAVAARCENN